MKATKIKRDGGTLFRFEDGKDICEVFADLGGAFIATSFKEPCGYCGKNDCYLECDDAMEALGGDQDVAADLRQEEADRAEFNSMMDGLEAMLMAMAANGVDISDQKIAQAVQDTLQGAANATT